MNGVIENEVLKVVLPPIVNGGIKLFDFGKTRKELAATRKELAEKDKKLTTALRDLDQSTKAVVSVTHELVETRETLANVLTEDDDYRHKMELILFGAGTIIAVLLVIVVVMAVNNR